MKKDTYIVHLRSGLTLPDLVLLEILGNTFNNSYSVQSLANLAAFQRVCPDLRLAAFDYEVIGQTRNGKYRTTSFRFSVQSSFDEQIVFGSVLGFSASLGFSTSIAKVSAWSGDGSWNHFWALSGEYAEAGEFTVRQLQPSKLPESYTAVQLIDLFSNPSVFLDFYKAFSAVQVQWARMKPSFVPAFNSTSAIYSTIS